MAKFPFRSSDQKPPADEPEPLRWQDFHGGDQIQHKDFGAGKVLTCNEIAVTFNFEKHGQLRLFWGALKGKLTKVKK